VAVRTLQDNCLTAMKTILYSEIVLPKKYKVDRDVVLEADDLVTCVDEIERLWGCGEVKEAFRGRAERRLHISTTSDYYFENARRFANESWLPTGEDILRARTKTTGIKEFTIKTEENDFTIIDVGGQRSERRKWMHCFDDCKAIIYLAALDEYDMFLEEDQQVNRLCESVELFGEVTSHPLLGQISWVLFLNKCDLLLEKISKYPISDYFEDVGKDEGRDYEKAWRYMRKKFEGVYKGGSDLTVHVTCVLDTKNCKRVFDAINKSILCNALAGSGLI